MVFGQPHFLWALVLLLIPIIVHLLQFKKQNVFYFPGVFRLVEILKVSERKRNIKRWLILASRLLAFLFLVLYFADPQWKKETQLSSSSSPKYIVFIDASPSMHINQNGSIPLQEAKNKAIEWVSSLSENAEIMVVHDLNKASINSWNSKANSINKIRSIQGITYPYSIKQIYQTLEPILNSNHLNSAKWVVFTDAYVDFFEGLKTLPSSNTIVSIVKIASKKIENFSLDTACLNSTGQKFRVKVSRNSLSDNSTVVNPEAQSSSAMVLKLIADNKVQSIQNLEWKEDEISKWLEFDMIQYLEQGYKFELSKDEFNSDNVLFAHFPNRIARKVFWAEGSRISSLEKLIRIQPNYFEKRTIQDANGLEEGISMLFPLKSIRNWDQIEPWLKNENRILIYPENGGLDKLFMGKWIDARNQELRLSSQGLNEPLFRSAFADEIKREVLLPTVARYFQLDEKEKSNIQVHLTLSNGEPFLISRNINSGTVFVVLSDSKNGLMDFERSTWFTPLLSELLLDRNNELGSIYGEIFSSKSLVLPTNTGFDLQRPVTLKNNSDFQLTTGLQLSSGRLALAMDFDHNESGFFELQDQQQKMILGLNIPRREKSFEAINESIKSELNRRKWNWYDANNNEWRKLSVNDVNSWFDFLVYLIILFFLTETILIMPWFALKEVNSQNQS